MAVATLPVRMASRWRRRRLCTLDGGEAGPATLSEISGAGATLQTGLRPAIGAYVILHHPDAGPIAARVDEIVDDGIHIAFDRSERAVAFALAAIVADMSTPR